MKKEDYKKRIKNRKKNSTVCNVGGILNDSTDTQKAKEKSGWRRNLGWHEPEAEAEANAEAKIEK